VLGVQVSSLMDRDVIYITGRDKSQKSKNGKSANLNNTLQLIYPEIRDPYNNDEFMKIPIHELMCLFDADQTCSKVPPSPLLCTVLCCAVCLCALNCMYPAAHIHEVAFPCNCLYIFFMYFLCTTLSLRQ
jgi:hypothetical protein